VASYGVMPQTYMVAVGPGDVGRISRAAVSYSRSGRGVPGTVGTGVDGQLCMLPTINARVQNMI
jgi:hypothetical protein